MLAAFDIETQGLNAQKFVLGTIVTEEGMLFRCNTKQEMAENICLLCERQAKQGKTLQIYAHNLGYDLSGVLQAMVKEAMRRGWTLKIKSTCPYIMDIVAQEEETKKGERLTGKFLDTMGIFNMPLSQAAELIGLKKTEMPEQMKLDESVIADETREKLFQYCENDSKICLALVKTAKRLVEEEGVVLRRYVSMGQISINTAMHFLSRKPRPHLFHQDYDEKGKLSQRKVIETHKRNAIEDAYRMGRVEAWKTGYIDSCDYADCNSLFPYAAIKMRFPDLRTERSVGKPLEVYSKKELFNTIGITKCLIRNDTNGLGVLPVRTEGANHYPLEGTAMLGLWTHTELRKAIQEGYSVVEANWSVVYDDAKENPLKEYMEEMYRRRVESKNPLHYWFYKQRMNLLIGKLAQSRHEREMQIASVQAMEEMAQKGFEPIKGLDLEYIYRRKEGNGKQKNKGYYCPVVSCLCVAEARMTMYDAYKAVGKGNLVYTDTDSIIGTEGSLKGLKTGKMMGEFKMVKKSAPYLCYGRKAYSIGGKARVSGVRGWIDGKDFADGKIKHKQMKSILQTVNLDEIGTFKETTRDLKEQLSRHTAREEELNNQKVFIDARLSNINQYAKLLEEEAKRLE